LFHSAVVEHLFQFLGNKASFFDSNFAAITHVPGKCHRTYLAQEIHARVQGSDVALVSSIRQGRDGGDLGTYGGDAGIAQGDCVAGSSCQGLGIATQCNIVATIGNGTTSQATNKGVVVASDVEETSTESSKQVVATKGVAVTSIAANKGVVVAGGVELTTTGASHEVVGAEGVAHTSKEAKEVVVATTGVGPSTATYGDVVATGKGVDTSIGANIDIATSQGVATTSTLTYEDVAVAGGGAGASSVATKEVVATKVVVWCVVATTSATSNIDIATSDSTETSFMPNIGIMTGCTVHHTSTGTGEKVKGASAI